MFRIIKNSNTFLRGSDYRLNLQFKPGVLPDAKFRSIARQEFSRIVEICSQKSSGSLPGMLKNLSRQYEHYISETSNADDYIKSGILVASLATALADHYGENAMPARIEFSGNEFEISFDPSMDYIHSFALLYALSFFQTVWEQNCADDRMVQLLELAELFFLHEYSLEENDRDPLSPFSGQFPPETINSFINFLHPDPENSGNLLKKILLLEDNLVLAEIMCEMLSSFSYVVCPASDGIRGLTRIESERYDLVISDINMPKLDGFGFLKIIREKKYDIPVILTTGYRSTESREEAIERGARDLIHKPFSMDDLIDTVSRVLPAEV
jgi:two-component system, chemotaxis family, chemotaxis protein CheY